MLDPLSQSIMFDFPESAVGVAELFPKAWIALENLTSPHVESRHNGLDQLLDLDAHRLSPLVASVMATRITDSDIELRFRVVQALGMILASIGDQVPSEAVRTHLKGYLSQMRLREIFALLQVADQYVASESDVADLLNSCSFAGNALADILLDRKTPISIRRQAINFSGRVGFLDCIPALKKLADRLESRSNGQRSMPFAPPSDSDEKTLLLAVQSALILLQSP